MTVSFLAVHLTMVVICCTSDLYIMHGQYSRLLIGKCYVHDILWGVGNEWSQMPSFVKCGKCMLMDVVMCNDG